MSGVHVIGNFCLMSPGNLKLKLDFQSGNAQFRSNMLKQWIQTEVTAWKCPIWVKIINFVSSVTLKFDGWPWKTKGHLYYVTSSSVYHFTAIGQFKLELQSGNTQFGSKSTSFCPVWPWDLTDDLEKQQGPSSMLLQAKCITSQPLANSSWSYSLETPNLNKIWRFFCLLWPWNFTDDLAKIPIQALCIIS